MLKRTLIAGAAVATGLMIVAPAATGQNQTCDRRQKVLGYLESAYQEARVATGVTSSGGLVEVLAGTKGDTWTIIVSSPDGTTCLVAAGEGWRAIQADPTPTEPHA